MLQAPVVVKVEGFVSPEIVIITVPVDDMAMLNPEVVITLFTFVQVIERTEELQVIVPITKLLGTVIVSVVPIG